MPDDAHQVVDVATEAGRRIDVGIAQSRRLVRLAVGVGLVVVMSLTGLQVYEIAALNSEINTITVNQAANRVTFQQTQKAAAKTYILACDIVKVRLPTVCDTAP